MGYFHFVLFSAFITLVPLLFGQEIFVRFQPFTFFFGQFDPCFFQPDHKVSPFLHVLFLSDFFQVVLGVQLQNLVPDALDLGFQNDWLYLVLVELLFDCLVNHSFCLLEIRLEDRVVWVFEHVFERLLEDLKLIESWLTQLLVLFLRKLLSQSVQFLKLT